LVALLAALGWRHGQDRSGFIARLGVVQAGLVNARSKAQRIMSMPLNMARVLGLLMVTGLSVGRAEHQPTGAMTPQGIVVRPGATALEHLAGRELRRYIYLRTGRLLPIHQGHSLSSRHRGLIVVGRKDWAVWGQVDPALPPLLDTLAPEQYLVRTVTAPSGPVLVVSGGDAVGTLYGAYRVAERLGVRFYLHGDVVPDQRVPLRLGPVDELGRPLFGLRGIQPFHDFPEGPDWWDRDDYLAILSQLPKLRMNFIGLHTYPEDRPHAEPTVWIGLPSDIGPGSTVRFSYPASYNNTLRAQVIQGNWGYRAKKTSAFALGAAQLFEQDDFGPAIMQGLMPQPETPQQCNELFARAAELLRAAFEHAHRLGIKTCVGTETPLVVPRRVRERLQAHGKSPKDPAVVTELYEGIFRRAAQAYPLDYYWFWTPENWTWEGTRSEQIVATTNDLWAAIAAHAKLNPPFRVATCGWVLGPAQDRAMFDALLPKDIALSCINRNVGRTPVDPAFARIQGRSKWAIPWLEDDPALTAPQLWVGRMRRDAADAHAYGCDGLMGIHWRTRIVGPAVSALAQAAWDQSRWRPPAGPGTTELTMAGPVGGRHARFPNHAIADTDEDPLYQSVRYDVSAYRLLAPNGVYTVTLKFCEPHYDQPGKRVFGVKLQDRAVLENLDIFARVGRDRALDFTWTNVVVTNGWLHIQFLPQIEYPSIAALLISNANFVTRINCGGPAWGDFAADWPESSPDTETFPPTADFYLDWARAEFGDAVAERAAAIFQKIDGRLPRPCDWVNGPGGIRPDPRPWGKVSAQYAFVDELAALAPQVQGAGYRERFDWWLNTFRYLRAMAQVNCTWAQLTNVMASVKAETNAVTRRALVREKALQLRRELVQLLTQMYGYLLATVSTPGELGTVANWEQHNFPDLLDAPGQQLADWLGEPLPPQARLGTNYIGTPRLIVPTLRSSYLPGEPLQLKVIVLASQPPARAHLYWRPLGRGRFAPVPLRHVARGVYQVQFPPEATAGEDLEYYLEVRTREGQRLRFPVTAPALNQTVVAQPASG
jgi:hypothetical protein